MSDESDYSYDLSDCDYFSHTDFFEVKIRQHLSEACAAELIVEAEKEAMNKEKTVSKKKKKTKRRKAPKDQDVNCSTDDEDNGCAELDKDDENSRSVEEEALNLNSAFISCAATKVISKKDKFVTVEKKSANRKVNDVLGELRNKIESGLKLVEEEKYDEAIRVYTKAIELQPNVFAFYGNRSYCYERIGKYSEALDDAKKALSLNCKCSINYYRKGSALIGLKKYTTAESAFLHVLKLDPTCQEARDDLILIKKLKLLDMGFTEKQAELGSQRYSSVEDAITGLLNMTQRELTAIDEGTISVMNGSHDPMSDVYISDEEDGMMTMLKNIASPEEINPRNPKGLKSLWVGELAVQVTEQDLIKCFSKYGDLDSVIIKNDYNRKYAFINFKDKTSPGRAMLALQGYPLANRHILIKFPIKRLFGCDAPIANANVEKQSKPKDSATKPTPVNGDECFYWRTRGFCYHGSECRYKHVKSKKGIGISN